MPYTLYITDPYQWELIYEDMANLPLIGISRLDKPIIAYLHQLHISICHGLKRRIHGCHLRQQKRISLLYHELMAIRMALSRGAGEVPSQIYENHLRRLIIQQIDDQLSNQPYHLQLESA